MTVDRWKHGLRLLDIAVPVFAGAAGAMCMCWQQPQCSSSEQHPERRAEHLSIGRARCNQLSAHKRRQRGTPNRSVCRDTWHRRKKRRRVEWEAGESHDQPGPEGWSLERAHARLALAQLAHDRLGAESALIEEDWVRYDLVDQVQRFLPCCEIAVALGPRLTPYASSLFHNGYCHVPDLWTMVAKSRKQNWLVEVGMVGAKMRSARQAVIDALVAHRTRYCGDSESEPVKKKRNLLQILDEPIIAPLEVDSEFPGAVVLDGLPRPGWSWQVSRRPVPGSNNRSEVARELRPAVQFDTDAAVPEGVVLIVGDTGSGKTTLLRHWASQILRAEVNPSDAGEPWSGVDTNGQQSVKWDSCKAIISQFGDFSTLDPAG